jgi:hypothetical protein
MVTITIVQQEGKLLVVQSQDASKEDIISMLQQALGEAIVDFYKED